MFFGIKRKIQYVKFDRALAGVLNTPPIVVTEGACTIVSMVGPNHVTMFLVSMKAFYRRVGGGRVVAILARDTPRASIDLLNIHLPGIELLIRENIDVGTCQRGGTWERLLHILDRTDRGEYVVQIDADVMTVTPEIEEVTSCIRSGTAFTMADDAAIVSMNAAAVHARSASGNYIGEVSERLFDSYPGHETLRYIRGSSGLAGFAPHGFSRARMEEFHGEMEKLVGHDRWREWGTEQCASNFAVANTDGAINLPYPAYTSFHPGCAREGVKMYHFIGTFRFDHGVFIDLARKEIAALKAGAAG